MEATYLFKSNKLFWMVKNVLSILVMLGLFLNSVNFVFAQEIDGTIESEQSDSSVVDDNMPADTNDEPTVDEPTTPDAATLEPMSEVTESEPIKETPPADTAPVPAPEEEQEQVLDPPVADVPVVEEPTATSTATTTEELLPTGKKFIKDPKLSVEEQLAAVHQHLTREGLPQVALDRLTAYETQKAAGPQGEGLIKRVLDFVTGNTQEAKEHREAVEFAKREPFKVETFEGKINTASIEKYEKDFSEAKEQGSLIQKVKNLFENGTFFNSDFDKEEENNGGILSWLFGPQKAIADASNNPDDYLAAGDEVVFSEAIQDLADSLNNDPLAMYNFVHDEVEYIPYYGSKKGSGATLAEKAGNDMDKASLLIAMYRYSNIPARYRHVDAKMDIRTVNELLGAESATSSAQILSLEKIPYTLYTLNGDPYFFVIEHTYVEAYLPYGVTRGADTGDGGDSQWVPIDPSVNAYYYEQSIDLVDYLNNDGFDIEVFFEDYLEGDYGTSTEPLDAFKGVIENALASSSPEYYPGLEYEDALAHGVTKKQSAAFIPGSLPFEISADLDTYDYIPNSLRHTVEFTIEDDQDNVVLNHTAYLSDVADKELLVTYDAATVDDQNIIDGFDTIYDVVPLSLVAVKPVIKVNGTSTAVGSATSTLGHKQDYTMEFTVPTRTMGSSVGTLVTNTYEKGTITGNTDAIALNTDRVVPFESRPAEDTGGSAFLSNQVLYQTATDYLMRLQDTHKELAAITGGDFTHTVTKASINNGIEVTYDSGVPYSFEWTGLRIDAYSKVRYFHRFEDSINTNRKEFMAIFGLQASQDESDIFEDNFEIESVATSKGLKMVADGEFAGVNLVKITQANENDIDSLDIATSTKTVFHTAVDNGRTVYTPSEAITYNGWEGLFYITIDFDGGDATYAIGEGLNGGYTTVVIENWPSGLQQLFRKGLLPNLTGTIITPGGMSVLQGAKINWKAYYESTLGGITIYDWYENKKIDTNKLPLGNVVLKTGYGTNDTVGILVGKQQLGKKYVDYDADIIKIADKHGVPEDLLKAVIVQESLSVVDEKTGQRAFDPKSYRYEAHKDYDWYSGPSGGAEARIESFPENRFSIGGTAIHGAVAAGAQLPPYSDYIKWSYHTSGYTKSGYDLSGNVDSNLTAQELLNKNPDKFWVKYKGIGEDWNFTAQLLLASSYGLAQVLYETALVRGFEPSSSGSARPITDLFKARDSIELSAKHLKNRYVAEGNWYDALVSYNGSTSYADVVYERWQNGEGEFKLIVVEE